MSSPDVVTFALSTGTKVTAPRRLAERMGYKAAEAPKASVESEKDAKPRPVKRSPRKRS